MLTIRIAIADPDALLTAFEAGALVRLESSATEGGIYAEVAAAALLSGLFEYYLVDAAGTSATWYRWRPSTAMPTVPEDYGDYSDPFIAGGPYLSTDQFRALAPSTLDDASLRILLDAAYQDMVDAAGPSGERTERRRTMGPLVGLARPAFSITEVIEGMATVVDPALYELSASGSTVRRLVGRWHRHVTVTYIPIDDTASRQRVQAELVKMSVAFNPGLVSQTIGTWSETYTQHGGLTYGQQRADVLATLVEAFV